MNPWTAAALVPVALIALGVIWALDGSDGSDWAALTVLAIGSIAIAAVGMVITPVGAALVSWGLFALGIGKVLGTSVDKKNKKEAANARRLELQSRRRELEKQQRIVDFGAQGARLYEQTAESVAQIAGSEAARSGWLGDPSDFDFRADLAAIADNLRRAEEIRKARGDGASIMHLTAADKKMLEDAQRAIAALESAAKERSRLIEECVQQAGVIDAQLAADRERVVMAKRRENLRNRLGPVLYGTQNIPAEIPSESADVVKARAAAFHELRGLLRNYRPDGDGGIARE